MRALRTYLSDVRGVAAVEGALLLPLFLGFVLGAVDTSNLLMERHRVAQGLELGANYLSKTRTPDSLTARARNIAVTGVPSGGASTVRGWSADDVTVTIRDVPLPGADPDTPGPAIARVAVFETAHTYQGFGFISALSRNTVVVRARHEERIDL